MNRKSVQEGARQIVETEHIIERDGKRGKLLSKEKIFRTVFS